MAPYPTLLLYGLQVPREAPPAHRLPAFVKGSDLCYELLEFCRIVSSALLDLLSARSSSASTVLKSKDTFISACCWVPKIES